MIALYRQKNSFSLSELPKLRKPPQFFPCYFRIGRVYGIIKFPFDMQDASGKAQVVDRTLSPPSHRCFMHLCTVPAAHMYSSLAV